MRYLLFSAFLIFAANAFSQEKTDTTLLPLLICDSLIANKTDEVTGSSWVGSKKNYSVGTTEKGIGIGLRNSSLAKTIIMTVLAFGGSTCIDEDDKMFLLFKDGKRLTLDNDDDFNCNRRFVFYLHNRSESKKQEIETLMLSDIQTVRLTTSSGFVQIDIPPQKAYLIRRTIECLFQAQ